MQDNYIEKYTKERSKRIERKEERAQTLFPPVFEQIYKPPATDEEKEAWDLGEKIANIHYKVMKDKIKERFLKLWHIPEITTKEIVDLYEKIDKFHFDFARNGYITQAKEQGYIAEGENYLFFFMCGWNSATNKPQEKSTC